MPEFAAEVFAGTTRPTVGDMIDEEIIRKIITPESRSLCRTGGSKLSGGQFISGNDREVFQRNLVKSLTENCKKQGVEILAVAITRVEPPQDIAEPVRDREVAKQKLAQFQQEKMQQLSEAKLQIEVLMAEQKQKVVQADAAVIVQTTKGRAGLPAWPRPWPSKKLKVTQTCSSRPPRIRPRRSSPRHRPMPTSSASITRRRGLRSSPREVAAFDGDGAAPPWNILVGKLAPGFQLDPSNSEGPLMDLFSQFVKTSKEKKTSPSTEEKARPRTSDGQEPRVARVPVLIVGGEAVNNSNLGRLAKVAVGIVALYLVGYMGFWHMGRPPGSRSRPARA